MPRAVKPWTWLREVCDRGPREEHFWPVMAAYYRHMSGDTGETFAGVNQLARSARKSTRTVIRCRDLAIELGWLHCPNGIRERAKSFARACVPDGLELREKDEELADHVAEIGNSENCDHTRQQIGGRNGESVAPHGNRKTGGASQIQTVAIGEKSVAEGPKNGANLLPKALQTVAPHGNVSYQKKLLKTEATSVSSPAHAGEHTRAAANVDSIREQRKAEEQRANEFRWQAEEYLDQHPEFDAGAITLMEFIPGLKKSGAMTAIKNHRKKKSLAPRGSNGSRMQY